MDDGDDNVCVVGDCGGAVYDDDDFREGDGVRDHCTGGVGDGDDVDHDVEHAVVCDDDAYDDDVNADVDDDYVHDNGSVDSGN